jgi:hypothetical protein
MFDTKEAFMTRRYLPRRRFDATLLAALNVLVITGGAAALYHWLSFAEMAPPTMLCTVADATPPGAAILCVGGTQVAAIAARAGG